MAQFLQETIDDHRKTFDSSNPRDLLDTYLYEIQKANEEGKGHHLFEGRDHGKLQTKNKNQHNGLLMFIFFLFRSSNAADNGRLVLCGYGNDQIVAAVGRVVYATPSGDDARGPRRTGPSCGSTPVA